MQKSTSKVNQIVLTWLLAACAMIGPFATDMYLPSFMDMQQSFGRPLADVQMTLTSYLVGFAIMTLFYGMISDVIGRKTTMVGGFFFFGLASLCAAFSTSLEWVIFFRGCQGLFAGCGTVIGMAVIRDLYGGPQAQRMMAYVTMVFGFGPAIAPVLGGYVAMHWGWHGQFYALVCVSWTLCLLCIFLLPESLPKSERLPFQPRLLFGVYRSSIENLSFLSGVLALGLGFMGQGVFIAGAADWCVNVLGVGIDEFWRLFLPLIAGTVTGSWISTRLAGRYPIWRIIQVGYAVMSFAALCSLFVIFWVDTPAWPISILPLMIYTTGVGLIRPCISLVLMDFFPKSRGTTSSLQGFFQTLLFAAASAIVVPLVYGSSWKYEFALICTFLCSAFCWMLSRTLRPRYQTDQEADRIIC